MDHLDLRNYQEGLFYEIIYVTRIPWVYCSLFQLKQCMKKDPFSHSSHLQLLNKKFKKEVCYFDIFKTEYSFLSVQ